MLASSYYRTERFRVRYSETDQMRVVYHINYLNWFELGRTAYIRESGFHYGVLEAQGILLPVTDAVISFKAPAHYDEEVEVRTWIEQITPVRLDFAYEIYRCEDQKLLVTGHTKHVFANPDFKPIRLPKVFPDLYNWLVQEYNHKLQTTE